MASAQFLVTGVVQGVGFRPFCVRAAEKYGLGGWVKNTSAGVVIRLEGADENIELYRLDIEQNAPPLASIRSVTPMEPEGNAFTGQFEILQSVCDHNVRVFIPPDLSTCSACMAEVMDNADRRHLYPFINCTDCGPRYSIIEALPYDRPLTTMKQFPMCEPCGTEYHDSRHRRYHAQPNACGNCGPHVWLTDSTGTETARGKDAIAGLVRALEEGKIAAIKGLGGFHLACCADCEQAVSELRRRKNRPHKPFAVMCRDMACAEQIATLDSYQRSELTSSQRPILLALASGTGVAPSVAPHQDCVGIMLPYTPLHHIIMQSFAALVMTSANISEQPLICENHTATDTLGGIADVFLLHNRDIHSRIDDSVVAVDKDIRVFIRRARGFVPEPIFTPHQMAPIFAAGAELKAAFAITTGDSVIMSPYLGDLKQMSVAEHYMATAVHFTRLYRCTPEICALDKHPMYASSRMSRQLFPDAKQVYVQHHHAHLCAALMDAGITGPTVGWILDGTGYGDDGTIWGGELLFGDAHTYERAGHFLPAPLPGGDASVLEPWRYASVLLDAAFCDRGTAAAQIFSKLPTEAVLKSAPHAITTTSCGRLFDGVSAILGIRDVTSYDGQAAMELEAAANRASGDLIPLASFTENDKYILDWRPAIKQIASGGNTHSLAAGFHAGLCRTLADGASWAAARYNTKNVVLSGGCFQNRTLLRTTAEHLTSVGLNPILHHRTSCNDESICIGQTMIAAAKG